MSEQMVKILIGTAVMGIVIVAFTAARSFSRIPAPPMDPEFPDVRAPSIPPTLSEEGVMCTMEVKLCPDGSAVVRSGPKCEFALCPEREGAIDGFERCVSAGNPVMESYPRRCAMDGATYTESIDSLAPSQY